MGGPANLYPPAYGYSLWVVYAVWISVVVMLYPACLWFARLKARRSDWWLGYL
jgi:ABC-type spermidine/putrescine transport system permease subunit I